MSARPRLFVVVLGLVLALLAGCGDDGGASATRAPGDPITADEADVLAGLLHRDFEAGGADFTVAAPFAEGTVLTLTGEVDFRRGEGSAQAVTSYSDGRPDDTRTLFFTATDLWYGDVPGLTEAVAAAGRPDVTYLQRPISSTQPDGTASLVDVLVQLVPRLSARADDDPRAFLERDYTWQGQSSVNGQLAGVYQFGAGTTVAVSAADQLLLQYVTRLTDQTFDVTVTLADHGERSITLPGEDVTAQAADYPDVVAELGF
ncbi:hypothetical protein ASG36_09535 [Geodermatophilus sp. Leaf369]|uniref:hypothetical protein n=1 Tax=Geodermatophilus sp. Leaf369 TaxID=1736354 RepID=UPI0006F3004A|nr:hypothetical protein [Geodermatophilus sp. Leaf369]KQS58325.1 hypothetical protein ASG36_09535 [Geodermatophilus sp. Leaf369]